MLFSKKLKKGDRVAIVSLSSGMLGEEFCSHNIEIGVKRLEEYGLEVVFMPNALKVINYLKEHPKARASDLKQAFLDDSIAGVICEIGGDDTYRLLPYSKKAFESYLEGHSYHEIVSSEIWYEERVDFSRAAVGTDRVSHKEERGFELLQGNPLFQGQLLGGCLESLYDILTDTRYKDEKNICEKYQLFPSKEEWSGKILFIETCEEKPTPQLLEQELLMLKEKGVLEVINGILIGKPQDEAYYEEYKEVYRKVIDDKTLPIVYNVNFGHAYPRCVLPYGVLAKVDMEAKKILLEW